MQSIINKYLDKYYSLECERDIKTEFGYSNIPKNIDIICSKESNYCQFDLLKELTQVFSIKQEVLQLYVENWCHDKKIDSDLTAYWNYAKNSYFSLGCPCPTAMLAINSGNVGIGSSTPTAKFYL